MKTRAKTELDFKRHFAHHWKDWLERYEPRRGSGMGVPDIQVLIYGDIIPVELKIGSLKEGRVYCTKVRPAQIEWHRKLWAAGGKAYLVVGVWDQEFGQWYSYGVPSSTLREWRNGWSVEGPTYLGLSSRFPVAFKHLTMRDF